MGEVDDWLTRHGFKLEAWQRGFLDQIAAAAVEHDGHPRLSAHMSRAQQSGKVWAQRVMIAYTLATDGHLDALTPSGRWCVTLSGLGVPLWVKVPRPHDHHRGYVEIDGVPV